MGVKFVVEVTSPLTGDDNEMLAGIAMMSMAIAQNSAAKTMQDEQGVADTCAKNDPERPTFFCVSKKGHRGRHAWRDFGDPEGDPN
jgi:hypothetical protein